MILIPSFVFADDGEDDGGWADLEFIGDGPEVLYSDGEISYRIVPRDGVETPESADINIYAGIPGDDPMNGWEYTLDRGYTFNRDSMTLTFNGDEIKDTPVRDVGRLEIAIDCSTGAGTEDEVFYWIGFGGCEFREAWTWYEEEDDRDMLPGWEGSISGRHGVEADCAEFPDYTGEYYVNDVIVDEADLAYFEEFKRDEEGDDYWWYFRIKRNLNLEMPHKVTFTVSYSDIYGEGKQYTFDINICEKFYNLDLWSANGFDRVLPGDQLDFFSRVESVEFNEHGDEWNDLPDKALKWELLEDGDNFAELQVDPGDPHHATLVAKDMPAGEDYYDQIVKIGVTLQGDNGEEIFRDYWVRITNDFYSLEPLEIENINVGETRGVHLDLFRYTKFDGQSSRSRIENATFEVSADPNVFEIGGDPNSGDFTLKRINNWDTNVDVFATWEEQFEDGHTEQRDLHHNYYFGENNYDMWFDEHDANVYDDSDWTITLNTNEFSDFSNLDLEWTFTGYRWGDGSDEEFEIPASEFNDCLSADKKSIKMTGAKMIELDVNEINVRVFAKYQGNEISETDAWFRLNESCITHGIEHMWLTMPAEFPDCHSAGTQRQMCWFCGEKRIVDVPARGHVLKQHKAVAATLKAAGSIEYWECTECHKLFSDAKGTKETKLADTVIPKGTSIAKLTAAKKGFTAKWTKQASYTTGYQLQYALNSKFTSGQKTVNVAGASVVTKKIAKLKAKKKYYVRIRTYRTINGKTYYSAWSPAKTVKTKK